MKKMMHVTALAVLAVSLVSSKSTVKDQPTPGCNPNCSLVHAAPVPDQPTPGCNPNCSLAQAQPVKDQPTPGCNPNCSL